MLLVLSCPSQPNHRSIYFIRFTTQPETEHPGILRIQSHIMANCPASQISAMTSEEVGEMCQFLSTMIIYQVCNLTFNHKRVLTLPQWSFVQNFYPQDTNQVAPDDKKLLTTRLKEWKRIYRTGIAKRTIQRVIEQLDGNK